MNVNSVNQMTFTGKIAQTKNGNEYNKTNSGKKVGIATGLGLTAFRAIKQRAQLKGFLSIVNNKAIKAIAFAGGILLGTAINVGIFLGLGAIADAIINKIRRNKADKKAEQA